MSGRALVAVAGVAAVLASPLPAQVPAAPPYGISTAVQHTIVRVATQAMIAAAIRRRFPDDQQRASCIADHESDGTPGHYTATAMNGSNTGLFQIDEHTWNPARNPRALPIVGPINWAWMLDPVYNAMVARRIYLYERAKHRNPWGPWTTRGYCNA